jgi:protocatechuate 3,4-dioxygenase beta subunit
MISRRCLVAGMAAGGVTLAAGAARAACALSAGQMDGPFYPLTLPSEQDVDLTQLASGTGRAAGEVIEVTGQVRDAACRPLAGCIIEVWQADTGATPIPLMKRAAGRSMPTSRDMLGWRPARTGPIAS